MAIPVYMFAGFLESGKTSFIASVLQDPGFTRDENTLIIMSAGKPAFTNSPDSSAAGMI